VSEKWKPICGYEGQYEVSDQGRVRSRRSGRVLRLNQKKNGYFTVDLYRDGLRKTCRVQRLVAAAFIGPSKLDVNHRSGMKWDNRPGNLEYATDSENMQHAFRLGLVQPARGQKHSQARFSRAQIKEIRRLLTSGKSQSEVARIFETSPGHVWMIEQERIWKQAA